MCIKMSISVKDFDYVIIGGGTAGLVLASRLSADPAVTVVVIEAGEANVGDPKILIPAQFGHTFTNPKYDWAFPTVKQKFANDRELIWSRGKGLGGSSGLNFYAWVKPPAKDVDAFEKLGNPGWNWNEYMKYSQRSETFHPPSEEETDMYPHTFETKFRGTTGPIHTTIPFLFHDVDRLFQETLVRKGLKSIKDPYGGDITGTWIANASLNPSNWTRSYAATGYLLPVQHRPNLTVLTDAMVTRILFDEANVGKHLTAKGVEYVHNRLTCTVNAKIEVILSAGAIQSPKILELSGIGRREVLAKIGVDVKIDLQGVGENVQEHIHLGVSYELAGSPPTYDRMQEPEYAAEAMKLHAKGQGPQRLGITSFAYFPLSAATPEAPALIERANAAVRAHGPLPPGLQEQLDLQLASLRDDSAPDLEIIAWPSLFTAISTPEPKKTYMTVLAVLNHPFSRGTIHAKSGDPLENPSIDPHYFENDFDLEVLVQHIKYIRTMVHTEPFKSGVVREMDPGPNCVTDKDIREYIKNNYTSTWHTVGSCSMLPRDKNGVVDPTLKVYGTNNLRVVDVSVVPIHIAAHTQATAYMIAEKAADLIRGFK
ncbi:GMC oxidoreductase [Mycena maculata]|uniref:GMC oxidoreductase n=1 Tax=Mycena maculata TaxID=230809 RepID=A0AAD7KA48_9AGAR|nr:GMC oxidoreductase [Mycena maculata]